MARPARPGDVEPGRRAPSDDAEGEQHRARARRSRGLRAPTPRSRPTGARRSRALGGRALGRPGPSLGRHSGHNRISSHTSNTGTARRPACRAALALAARSTRVRPWSPHDTGRAGCRGGVRSSGGDHGEARFARVAGEEALGRLGVVEGDRLVTMAELEPRPRGTATSARAPRRRTRRGAHRRRMIGRSHARHPPSR